MKRDLILAGVGGQGLLALAAVIGEAARSLGLQVRQAEVHGMAQRGGVVQSHLRYADHPLHSPLVRKGCADLVLSLEPMEALRYLPYLAPHGVVVSSTVPVKNTLQYPDEEKIRQALQELPRHRLVDAPGLAKRAGALQAANMVLLGAGAAFLDLPFSALEAAIRAVFAGKPEKILETNLRALHLGMQASSPTDS